MEWISVKVRLPELVEDYGHVKESVEVFVTNGDDVFVGWLHNTQGWCIWGQNKFEGITHWMEMYEGNKMPEPPKN